MSTKQQTIFRVINPGTSYTIVSNKLCKDKLVSMGCKGLLLTILSQPDDWQVKPKWLMENYNIGRNEVYKLLTEAVEAGYCVRRDIRDDVSGRLTGRIEYVFASDPDVLLSRYPTCRDTGVNHRYPDIPISGKSVRLLNKDRTTNYRKNTIRDDVACAIEKDQQPEAVSIVDGIPVLHGTELETYTALFDGDADALQSALVQAAAYIQPNGSKPLLVQVRAQLQRKIDQRRDFRRRDEARAKEAAARRAGQSGNSSWKPKTKSQAIRAKQRADDKADRELRAPVWKQNEPEQVERYSSENPFFERYCARLETQGRKADAEEIRKRGWVKERPSVYLGGDGFIPQIKVIPKAPEEAFDDAPRGEPERYSVGGYSVRDTSEPVADYIQRMIREGKFKPQRSSHAA